MIKQSAQMKWMESRCKDLEKQVVEMQEKIDKQEDAGEGHVEAMDGLRIW